MTQPISHSGIVRSVGPKETTVEILSTSACASCHAAGLCHASEAAKKDVQVPTDPNVRYEVGEEVEVLLSQSMGLKAVWISYAIPVVILLILVVSLSYTKLHELVAGLIGVGGVGLYYLIIYLLRDYLAKDYVFSIRKKG